MPDSAKDRPGDLGPSLVNGYSASSLAAGSGTGAQHSPDSSSTSLKRLHQLRPDHSPLSIALPLSIRSNGQINSVAALQSGPMSAGYLDYRRDPFPSQTHPSLSSTSFQHLGGSTNLLFHTQPAGHPHDDHQPTLSLYQRPQSLSYASQQHPQHRFQQHASSSPSLDQDGMMRRRRLSTASTSSKQRLGSSTNLRSKAHNTPHHTRRFTTLISDQEPDTTYLWGYLLFFATMIGFTVSMYALVASNYMPMTGNKTLDWIKQDSHYCMLVPVTIPVTVLAVLFNWLGMKLFRHN